MNHLLRWRDEHHMLPLLLISSVVMLLAIAAAALWSRGMPVTRFIAPHSLKSAYERVQVGRTLQSQLASLGFDSENLQARSLSAWACRNISCRVPRANSTCWTPRCVPALTFLIVAGY